MDEEILEKTESGNAEIYLATVQSWSNATGVKLKFDGESSTTSKGYKMLLCCRPLPVGARVAVVKHSGTYFVLGEISNPNSRHQMSNLASGATLAQTVSKVNEIINWMVAQGMCYQ